MKLSPRLKTAVFFLTGVFAWTLALAYSQNTLENNGDWVSEKCKMILADLGSMEAQSSRWLLAGAQLNLQRHTGYQEIFYRRPVNLSRISWKFKINDSSYLDFVFNRGPKSFSGIRMSSRQDLLNINFDSDIEGRFSRQEGYGRPFDGDTWYSAELEETPQGLRLSIDGEEERVFAGLKFENAEFGFRGGHSGGVVAHVVFQGKDGSLTKEDFFALKSPGRLFLFNLAVFLVLLGVAAGGVAGLRRSSFWGPAAGASRAFMLLGLLWFAFDFFYFSKLEGKINAKDKKLDGAYYMLLDFDAGREIFFRGWYDWAARGGQPAPEPEDICHQDLNLRKEIYYCVSGKDGGCEIYNFSEKEKPELAEKLPPPDFSILYMGGSFTRGSGANLPEQTFFRRVHGLLSRQLAPKTLASTNFGAIVAVAEVLDGQSIVERLIDGYEQHLKNNKYDVIILTTVLVYDRDLPRLKDFFEECIRRKITLIVMPQPENFERQKGKQGFVESDDIADPRRYAELVYRHGMKPLMLAPFLKETDVIRSGVLWRDGYHLTSYGQQLVAEQLAPRIFEALQKGRKNK